MTTRITCGKNEIVVKKAAAYPTIDSSSISPWYSTVFVLPVFYNYPTPKKTSHGLISVFSKRKITKCKQSPLSTLPVREDLYA